MFENESTVVVTTVQNFLEMSSSDENQPITAWFHVSVPSCEGGRWPVGHSTAVRCSRCGTFPFSLGLDESVWKSANRETPVFRW